MARFYRHLHGGATNLPPTIQTSRKITRLCGAIPLLVFNKSLSNLAILLVLSRSFKPCWRIFPNWSQLNLSCSQSRIEKIVEWCIRWCTHMSSHKVVVKVDFCSYVLFLFSRIYKLTGVFQTVFNVVIATTPLEAATISSLMPCIIANTFSQ